MLYGGGRGELPWCLTVRGVKDALGFIQVTEPGPHGEMQSRYRATAHGPTTDRDGRPGGGAAARRARYRPKCSPPGVKMDRLISLQYAEHQLALVTRKARVQARFARSVAVGRGSTRPYRGSPSFCEGSKRRKR